VFVQCENGDESTDCTPNLRAVRRLPGVESAGAGQLYYYSPCMLPRDVRSFMSLRGMTGQDDQSCFGARRVQDGPCDLVHVD